MSNNGIARLNFAGAHRPLYEIKAEMFKGLGHPYRIRVLELLSATDELTVGAMLDDMGLEASHLSQHLAVLRKYRLVVSDRRASVVFYRLAYPEVAELLRIARVLLREIVETTRENLDSIDDLPELA